MNEPTDIRDRIAEERQLAGLIRQGGPRAQPPEAVREAVRAAAEREWRAVVAARNARRRTGWSLAAAAAVAGLAVWVGVPALRGPGPAVATVARVSGPVEASGGGVVARFAALAEGAGVPAGAGLRSGRGGRAALDLGGNSVRLDEQSAVTVLAANRIALASGAVYVDSGAGAAPLVIETPYGAVEHLGTQYESRLVADGLRLRVREGRVRLSADSRAALEGAAGEQLTVAADGAVRREPVARADRGWAWAGEIAPPFDIENRTLGEFLGWAARETGREVAYATPELEAEASRVVLRGSVQGLAPERALAAVLATTDFAADADAAGRWVIDLKAGDR